MFAVGVGGGDVGFKRLSPVFNNSRWMALPVWAALVVVGAPVVHRGHRRAHTHTHGSDRAAGRLRQGAHHRRFRERVGPCMTGLGISNSERPEARVDGEEVGR